MCVLVLVREVVLRYCGSWGQSCRMQIAIWAVSGKAKGAPGAAPATAPTVDLFEIRENTVHSHSTQRHSTQSIRRLILKAAMEIVVVDVVGMLLERRDCVYKMTCLCSKVERRNLTHSSQLSSPHIALDTAPQRLTPPQWPAPRRSGLAAAARPCTKSWARGALLGGGLRRSLLWRRTVGDEGDDVIQFVLGGHLQGGLAGAVGNVGGRTRA